MMLKQSYFQYLPLLAIGLTQVAWADNQQKVEADVVNYLNSQSVNSTDNVGLSSLGQLSIQNAGFETGDTSEWMLYIPQGGIAQVVNSHVTSCYSNVESPFDGDFFLELKTDGPGSYTTAAQFFTLQPGDTLYGAALFDSPDYPPFFDTASVKIYFHKPSGIELVATPWKREADDCNSTPSWAPWSWTASQAGLYAITYRVTNALDSIVDSYALFDSAVCSKEKQLLCDAAFLGTNGADTIIGSNDNDIICSRGGDDEILGLGGDDLLCGGSGQDELYGGDGHDMLYGGDDEDELYAGKGDDLLYGGDKTTPDMLYGGQGEDTCIAERGSKRRDCEIKIREKVFLNN